MGQDASTLQGLANSGIDANDLQRFLQLQENSNDGDQAEVAKLLSTIRLLFASSKARILTLADKLSCNEVGKNVELVDVSDAVDIPVAESWDFRLGDRVRIKYSMRDFKRIQSKTLGWGHRLRTVHSYDAVVTKRLSKYENGVAIYTEPMLSVSLVYAGVLEKIPESETRDNESFSTQWRVNDYVMIAARTNDKVVEIMQRGLNSIPVRYFGRRGRIVAITRVAVLVTFNERSSNEINSALLTKCANQSPLVVPTRKHEKDFVLGQKVRVTDNIKELVNDQKTHGGWSDDMTKIIGKKVTIVHIRKNGDLFVQYKTGRTWAINSNSVTRLESSMTTEDTADDGIFRRGDVVKVKTTDHIRPLMRTLEIPSDFLEYLRLPAKIVMIDDDLDYMITFNGQQNVQALAPNLSAASSEERERYNEIKCMTKEIAVGASVVLDVGPLNYVTAVLRDSSIDPDVINVLTARSTLIGFNNGGKAVIETENGKRFRVGRKYLTVPDKFNM